MPVGFGGQFLPVPDGRLQTFDRPTKVIWYTVAPRANEGLLDPQARLKKYEKLKRDNFWQHCLTTLEHNRAINWPCAKVPRYQAPRYNI